MEQIGFYVTATDGGTNKTMGEMPIGEQRARTALALLKLKPEFEAPAIAKIVNA